MIIIAFAGKMGSGKTTAAQMLVKNHGFERVSFAAPLYDMLEAGGFGRPKTLEEKMAVIDGLGFTWRHAAQTLGTEWGRHCLGDDIWTKLALRKCSNELGRYVFDDLRFENEATALREAGATIVHLQGRNVDAGGHGGHASEQGILFHPRDDELLGNTGTLEDLEIGLTDLLNHLMR